MNLNSILHQLSFFGEQPSMLVCETDGFHLNAVVISQHNKQLKVDFSAQSDALDYQDAVKAVITRLREQGWKGRHAVLLTPSVLSAVIELPVPHQQTRSPLQMQELIRWELEPLLIQHEAAWSIGQLLLTKGYMTETQLAEVLALQQGKTNSKQEVIHSFKPCGEFSVDLGYISQAQLDECMARQAWLQTEGDDILCGWATPTKQTATANMPADSTHVPWLVSGVRSALVYQWEAAFLSQKIVLSNLYSLVGCASALIPKNDNVLLLENAYGFVGALSQHSGVIKAIETQKRPTLNTLDTCLESYHHAITSEINQLWLSLRSDTNPSVTQKLSEIIGREIHTITTLSSHLSAGMQGVANHLLTLNRTAQIAGVSVQGPKPSIFERVEVRAIAAGLLLMLVIGALETSLFVNKSYVQTEYVKAVESKKQFDAIVAVAQSKVDTVNKLKADITAKTAALDNLNARFYFFASELPNRATFVQKTLDNLSYTVTPEVVINSIEETPDSSIRFSAWALSEKSAQQFIQSYKTVMASLGMELHDPIVRSQTGPLGLYGYDVQFRLLHSKDTATAQAVTDAKS